MAKKNSRNLRVDLDFLKEINDIQVQRILNGKDKLTRPKSPRRISQGIPRHKDWIKIKKDLINADLN